MRAAMTRQLEPYTLHSRLPHDEHVPAEPPHFAAYIKTDGRMRYWLHLLQQSRAPQALPQALPPSPTQARPMEVDPMEDTVAEQHSAPSGGGIPNMVPGNLLTQGIPLRDRPPSALTYAASHPLSRWPAGIHCSSPASSWLCGYSAATAHQWPTRPF